MEVHPHAFLIFTTDTGEHTAPPLPAESGTVRKEDVCVPQPGFMLLKRDVAPAEGVELRPFGPGRTVSRLTRIQELGR